MLAALNDRHLASCGHDPQLEARIRDDELAARMQLSAPEAFALEGETRTPRRLYGLDDDVSADFGRRCLLARRLLERGVRYVQVWSGAGRPTTNWDNHTSMVKELPPMCRATDTPIAGLLTDTAAQLCAAFFDRPGYPARRCTFRPAFTATGFLSELEDKGFLDPAEVAAAGRGRPPKAWKPTGRDGDDVDVLPPVEEMFSVDPPNKLAKIPPSKPR